MHDPYQIVRRPLITEKSYELAQDGNVYAFEVAPRARKEEIARAVEKLYEHKDVHVEKVRTMNRRGKPRRSRMRIGTTRHWKKALITLREGESLDLF